MRILTKDASAILGPSSLYAVVARQPDKNGKQNSSAFEWHWRRQKF